MNENSGLPKVANPDMVKHLCDNIVVRKWEDLFSSLIHHYELYLVDQNPYLALFAMQMHHAFVLALRNDVEEGDATVVARKMMHYSVHLMEKAAGIKAESIPDLAEAMLSALNIKKKFTLNVVTPFRVESAPEEEA